MLTVSEASKRDILRYFTIPEEKITVIHNGLDDRFRQMPPEAEIHRVRERFQLQERSCCTRATSSRTRTSSG